MKRPDKEAAPVCMGDTEKLKRLIFKGFPSTRLGKASGISTDQRRPVKAQEVTAAGGRNLCSAYGPPGFTQEESSTSSCSPLSPDMDQKKRMTTSAFTASPSAFYSIEAQIFKKYLFLILFFSKTSKLGGSILGPKCNAEAKFLASGSSNRLEAAPI